MTTTAGEMSASPRFRLRTFGTLRLVGSADDTVLGDSGHQRRRLALLAVLAASSEHGRSRDQLLGLFWPEVSQPRARHSLEQLLYTIRTSLGERVFTGANPLRLNVAAINSDISDFTDALAREGLEAAVGLYRGRFLEGFYLSDAPEFEQWMEAERGRVEGSYMDALDRLASRAEDANDFAAAARWRQKLIETDPLSSKHAIGLIRALVNAGDHPAALRFAERYEGIVGQELGTSVGPALARLVADVRAGAKTESVIVRSGAALAKPQRAEISSMPPTRAAAALEPKEATTHRRELTTPRLGAPFRAAVLFGAALLLATVLVAAWLRPRGVAGPRFRGPSIAVLPLANVSGDPHDASLVDGLSEELIGVLSKIDRLRVVAPTSAFIFKNSNIGERRIADSLGVSNLLRGGLQRVGQRVRVQVRLVDARDGSTRWSETYERELKDIFLVQSEIAAAVARELDLRLGGRTMAALRRQPTQNIAAYELYLRGNDPTLFRSDSGLLLGIEYFRKAIALDSTYAAAYAGLSRMYLKVLLDQRATPSVRELYAQAKEAALKGVALNDSLAEAHAAVGDLLMVGYDLPGAEKELKRAVAMDPSDRRTSQILLRLYEWEGRPSDAVGEANRGVEIDPLASSPRTELARALCANGQYSDGLAWLKRLEAVQPPLLRLPLYTGLCHGMRRDWPAAVAAMRPYAASRLSRGRGFLGFALARAGRRQEALAVLADVMDHSARTNQGAFEVAMVYAGLGNRDQAFEWLDRSIEDMSLSENIMLAFFDDLHADSRFARLRRRLGLQNP